MRWLVRVFASAIARRIAYVAAAALLAAIGINEARAQTYICTSSAAKCTDGQAFAEANAYANRVMSTGTYSPESYEACVRLMQGSYSAAISYKGGCGGWSTSPRNFYFVTKCADASSYTGTGPWSSGGGSAPNGSLGCRNGCDGQWASNADSTMTWSPTGGMCPEDEQANCVAMGGGYKWNEVLKVCQPSEQPCPEGQVKDAAGQCGPEPCPEGMTRQPDGTCKPQEQECPAGQIKSPDGQCLPGDGQCAEGETRGPDGKCTNGDGDGDEDGDGDGGDGGGEKQFSGGEDCSAPPSCSGDVIMCGMARIQWRIDCNTRRSKSVTGGACGAVPVCTGDFCDALEYSQLLMQWRTACSVEKLALSNGSANNPDIAAIRAALTGTDGKVETGTSNPGKDAWFQDKDPDAIRPDTTGYGWGTGTCPRPPAIEIMGRTLEFDTGPLCTWLRLGSFFVMGLAALASLRIVAGKEA